MNQSQILIAEDESIVAMDIQEALKNARYSVSAVANSGREALAMAAETRPDLVLMDIRLKGDMDGVQAATHIKENFDIPVIYLSVYSDEDTVQRAKLTEPFGYLLKPFEKRELNTAIEVALYKHKMEKELKENRRWLSAILSNTADAVIATDARGLVTFMNPTAETLTGWKGLELLGRMWTDAIRLYEADDGEASLRREFMEGRTGHLSPHATLATRDGSRCPVDGSIAPIKDEKGVVTGFVLVLRDVTVRKRLEEDLQRANAVLERRVEERTASLARVNAELQDSESRFRSIAETAPDGVVLADESGRIVFVNRSTQTLFGHAEKELLGRSVFVLISEKFQDAFKAAVRGLGDDRAAHRTVELTGHDKAGREFPVELSLSTWLSGGGRLYAGILRDVSERRQAESNLRFQAGILSQVKDAVIAVDSDGRVVYWSRGAERLYGVKTVDAIGQELGEIPAGGRWLPPEAEEALGRSEVWYGEALHHRKDGEEIPVEMYAGPLRNDEDLLVGRLMVLREVTERKRLEGMLLHAERVAAMGQMAAAVANELKSPLGVIHGFADILRQRFERGEDGLEMLETLKRQASRCVNLVDNLLSFSNKGRGPEGRPVEEDVDVGDVAEAALTLVGPHAEARAVEVKRQLSPDILLVRGVREMLEQVVVNLALNAVESMAEGGTLTLSTRLVKQEGASRVRIDVADTGTGIPPEVRRRLFEPFFTTKGRGAGLGLWLVRQILTGLRGDISCTSEVGRGTVFSLTLPALEERG